MKIFLFIGQIRYITAVLGVLLLTSCSEDGSLGQKESPAWHSTASSQTKITYFKEQCLAFGFKDGTTAMSQCIQNQMNRSKSRASQRMNKGFTCRTFGNTTICD